jgi:hypothetical protein
MYKLFLLSMCAAITGCFPYDYTDRPGVAGTVVSSDSHEPVAGAGISFGPVNAVAYSATDGSFSVPPKKEWGVWIIPQDVFTLPCAVSIRRNGYEAYETNVMWNPSQRAKYATKQLGIIPLVPIPK